MTEGTDTADPAGTSGTAPTVLPPGAPATSPVWDDDEAAAFGDDDLGRIVYASRLLGRDPSLVLAGGGNSSAKASSPMRSADGSTNDVAPAGRSKSSNRMMPA